MEEKILKVRTCPYCKQQYNIQTGFSNWKNLFRKPTLDDFIVLLILILVMLSAYAYTLDIKTCSETLKNIDEICAVRLQSIANGTMSLNNQTLSHFINNDT
jgi:hypothetical protein